MSERFYDHKQYLAERHTEAHRGAWEPVSDDSPIIHVKQALRPTEQPTGAIVASHQGAQIDDAETISRGILLQALPVIALSLPLSICIAAFIWMTGVVSVGLLGYVVGVLGLWGGLSLAAYNAIARRAHKFSFYGTEQHKADAHERIVHHEIDSRERIAIKALETHERLVTGRKGQS